MLRGGPGLVLVVMGMGAGDSGGKPSGGRASPLPSWQRLAWRRLAWRRLTRLGGWLICPLPPVPRPLPPRTCSELCARPDLGRQARCLRSGGSAQRQFSSASLLSAPRSSVCILRQGSQSPRLIRVVLVKIGAVAAVIIKGFAHNVRQQRITGAAEQRQREQKTSVQRRSRHGRFHGKEGGGKAESIHCLPLYRLEPVCQR